jgi:acyl dehydratase
MIDVAAALSADPSVRELSWTADDVLLYHLSLGAGADRCDPAELRWIYERDLHVLPTFAVVAGARTGEVPAGGAVRLPGIDIDLGRILHVGQSLTLHALIPVCGSARATSRTAHVWDKGKAAVIVTETAVTDTDGKPLWTSTSQIWARGEGGFGGEPGPRTLWSAPPQEPHAVLDSATSLQTAALYRLNADRNALHIDPAVAKAAGFERPILHGLASYGIVCKALVDELLDGDPARVRSFAVRFAGVLLPGETIRTRVWRKGNDELILRAECVERDGAPVLTHATMTIS